MNKNVKCLKDIKEMKEKRLKMEDLDSKKVYAVPSRKAAATVRLSNVVYVGRIPHGFYEQELRGYFGQFGSIKKLRLSRNKKTGKSKHFGFIQFESPEVAAIVAESMNNYLLFESLLQVKLVPEEKIHPNLWSGANRKFIVRPWRLMEKRLHNRARTSAEQKKLVQRALRRENKIRSSLRRAGIDYDIPGLRASLPRASKKTKFIQEEE